MFKDKW